MRADAHPTSRSRPKSPHSQPLQHKPLSTSPPRASAPNPRSPKLVFSSTPGTGTGTIDPSGPGCSLRRAALLPLALCGARGPGGRPGCQCCFPTHCTGTPGLPPALRGHRSARASPSAGAPALPCIRTAGGTAKTGEKHRQQMRPAGFLCYFFFFSFLANLRETFPFRLSRFKQAFLLWEYRVGGTTGLSLYIPHSHSSSQMDDNVCKLKQ